MLIHQPISRRRTKNFKKSARRQPTIIGFLRLPAPRPHQSSICLCAPVSERRPVEAIGLVCPKACTQGGVEVEERCG